MSTTTDPQRPPPRRVLRHAASLLVVGAAALAGWLTILLAVTAIAEPHPNVLVFGPPQHTLSLLRETDIRVADLQANYAVLHGRSRGFVRTLYARGALLVLPARAPGCFGFMPQRG